MNVLTAGSSALVAATVSTLVLCWLVLTLFEWLSYTFRKVFRG
jgi:hypothetical protein